VRRLLRLLLVSNERYMTVHCRCRHCDTRRVLPKHPSKYLIVPPCRVCGERYVFTKNGRFVKDGEGVREPIFRVDGWMMRRSTRAMACMCPAYAWEGRMTGAMHRRGSLQCWYRADGSKREHGDVDYFMEK
jgi:hypothetical protein